MQPWYHLGRAAPHGAGLKGCQHTPGRDDGRSRRSLTKGKLLRSVRGSETIFHPARRALFHRPGLSAALHRMYSSLPCLCGVSLLPFNLHQNRGLVKH